MENINNLGEQPNELKQTLNVEEQQNINETNSGSPIGKFKSVEALSMAYQNLEKEFTQKCQKIKELTEKNIQENMASSIPEYKRDDWEEKVRDFFSIHPEAKEYVAEISEVLSNNQQIANSKNSLEFALTKVLADKFVPYSSLVEDENFLQEYIYSNKKVKDKVVENYLDNIQNERALPLISSNSGAGAISSPISKPKTIKDAGKMVEAYLKNK